jgi:hypothetical protein
MTWSSSDPPAPFRPQDRAAARSLYLFITLYCFIERYLSGGDDRRN